MTKFIPAVPDIPAGIVRRIITIKWSMTTFLGAVFPILSTKYAYSSVNTIIKFPRLGRSRTILIISLFISFLNALFFVIAND
jgi:hypothetical protein